MIKTIKELFQASRKAAEALSEASSNPAFAKHTETHVAKVLAAVFPKRKPHKSDKRAITAVVTLLARMHGPFKPGRPVKFRPVDGLIVIGTVGSAADGGSDPTTMGSLWDWFKQLIGLGPGSGVGGGGGSGPGGSPSPGDDLVACQQALGRFDEAMEAFDEANENWIRCTHAGMPGGGGGGSSGGGGGVVPEETDTPTLPPVYIDPCQDELDELMRRSEEVDEAYRQVDTHCDFDGS